MLAFNGGEDIDVRVGGEAVGGGDWLGLEVAASWTAGGGGGEATRVSELNHDVSEGSSFENL